ncbi:MAG: helix-turn-helix transcriptional regulator [Planctomycetes bacterium]|nr:helix-turn-helix transcriptional regulator [Planctomycetota bacterium]
MNDSDRRDVYKKLEDVVGCKWSVSVLMGVGSGVHRPGALERHIEGISSKVLNERLRKLSAYGLLEKQSFDEKVLKTEYHLSAAGKRLLTIITQIHLLDNDLEASV